MTKGSDVFIYEARGFKREAEAADGFNPGAKATKDEHFSFWRSGGEPKTNVPWRVKQHSPDGFEWGYEGSGPADLSLNILEEVLLGVHHKGPRTKCFAGTCFQAAWMAHQAFKREFVANIPREGGVINRKAVETWLAGYLINYGGQHA